MEAKLRERFGISQSDIRIARSFDGRLLGQSWETPFVAVPAGTIDDKAIAEMIQNFHDTYQIRTGNRFAALGVQGVTYRVAAIVPVEKVDYPLVPTRTAPLKPTRTGTLQYFAERPIRTAEYDRTHLCYGDEIQGPAIIRESLSTTFVLPGQVTKVGRYGELRIRKAG